MAKNQLIDTDLFKRTTTVPEIRPGVEPVDDLRKRRGRNANDPVKSYGVGLRVSQWARFASIANELGTSYHDLAVYILTDFMTRWEKGERPPTETKQVLKRS